MSSDFPRWFGLLSAELIDANKHDEKNVKQKDFKGIRMTEKIWGLTGYCQSLLQGGPPDLICVKVYTNRDRCSRIDLTFPDSFLVASTLNGILYKQMSFVIVSFCTVQSFSILTFFRLNGLELNRSVVDFVWNGLAQLQQLAAWRWQLIWWDIQQTQQIKRYSLLIMVNPVLLLLDGNEKKYKWI